MLRGGAAVRSLGGSPGGGSLEWELHVRPRRAVWVGKGCWLHWGHMWEEDGGREEVSEEGGGGMELAVVVLVACTGVGAWLSEYDLLRCVFL